MTPEARLRCHYYEAGRCRSCALIESPYAAQLEAKQQRCLELLPQAPSGGWLRPFSGGDRGFRNRAKLVVGGRAGEVTFGILDYEGQGVDLRECAIQDARITAAIPKLATFLEATGLPPYEVPTRSGEVKFVHVTVSPSSELMVRFVVRSEHALRVLRSHLTELRELLPHAAVISVNLLPEHKAVLEGEREELLLGSSLPMRLGFEEQPLTLHLRPQSFFQTNTAVAQELYAQVASWVAGARPASLWDLYCGVGGFALHCGLLRAEGGVEHGGQAGEIVGVELSEAAVESARRSSYEANIESRFVVADATEFALAAQRDELPELVIVNPPRRGLGDTLAGWLEQSEIRHLVYSSCNPVSLAKDLARMPSYAVREARVFDMFPHTSHLEVAVLLERD